MSQLRCKFSWKCTALEKPRLKTQCKQRWLVGGRAKGNWGMGCTMSIAGLHNRLPYLLHKLVAGPVGAAWALQLDRFP